MIPLSIDKPINVPPATPAPISITSISQDARERFTGCLWLPANESDNLDDQFLDYDHWEAYDKNKSYSKRPYLAAYCGVMRPYQNILCILDKNGREEYYVLAKRLRSEYEHLEKYCFCWRCKSSAFSPMKYLWCPTCTGCLKAGPGLANPDYVELARQEYNHRDKKTVKTWRNLPWTTIVEYTSLIVGVWLVLT